MICTAEDDYYTERHSTVQNGAQNAGQKTVQTFDRAVAILDAFTTDRPELGVSEIARVTGLSRSTVHRLLATLRRHELVQQIPTTRNYALGPHLLRLAQIAFSNVNLQNVAKMVMTELRDRCDETVGLHIRLGPFTRTVLDQVESKQALRRTYNEIGVAIPIYQGAPGKVLLGNDDPEFQEKVLHGKLEAATPRTITDPDKLRTELRRAKKNGYAFSFEERVVGISTVAVPIADHTGQVIAALSVTGPNSRVGRKQLLEFVPHAQDAAGRISASLGFTGDSLPPAATPTS
ncbi:MAG: IclR family transcriptional regulator [Actinomycetota bacterium]